MKNTKNKTLCIIQARMGSTRLPEKMLKKVEGIPLLEHCINRTGTAKLIDKVVIATTTNKKDAKIEKLCKKIGTDCFRGSENDVLDRYYQCSLNYPAYGNIIRITGDCPLIDPNIIDKTAKPFLKNNFDYISTGHIIGKEDEGSGYPDGLDTEVFSFKALEKAWQEAKLPSEREHVTTYIWGHPELFKIKGISNKGKDLSHLRWTVDKPKDLKFVRGVYRKLYKKNNMFYMEDVLKLLEKHPQLTTINSDIQKDAGYYKSLREDKIKKNKSY